MNLIILTGASGAGKTTIVKELEKQMGGVTCLFFDSIDVPTSEDMISQYGSGEGWQKAKTFEWIGKIKSDYDLSHPLLFEGQSRISSIKEALYSNMVEATIVLIDCNDEVRRQRLAVARNQPELANEQMMGWARFLRNEAHSMNIKVVDTSKQTLSQSVDEIKKLLK